MLYSLRQSLRGKVVVSVCASIYSLALALGCQSAPSQQECEKAAARRVKYFAMSSKVARSKGLAKESLVKECLAHWSKKKALCIAKAKNRNMLISCK